MINFATPRYNWHGERIECIGFSFHGIYLTCHYVHFSVCIIGDSVNMRQLEGIRALCVVSSNVI